MARRLAKGSRPTRPLAIEALLSPEELAAFRAFQAAPKPRLNGMAVAAVRKIESEARRIALLVEGGIVSENQARAWNEQVKGQNASQDRSRNRRGCPIV
jgi:hypothetical protein